MLAKRFRLRKKEMDRLYKKGSVLQEGFVLARFLTNRANHNRFAVVVPKAVIAKAIGRNRLRRKIYEILADFKDNSAYDIGIFIKSPDEAKIKPPILNLLKKAGIIKLE